MAINSCLITFLIKRNLGNIKIFIGAFPNYKETLQIHYIVS